MTGTGSIFAPVEIEKIDKPWGYELIWARASRYVGKILHVNQGESLSLQYHEKKEETLYLIRGLVQLTLRSDSEEKIVEMREGQSFHIPPRLIHRMKALEDSDIAEVSTTELDDVVRLEDRYGRTAG